MRSLDQLSADELQRLRAVYDKHCPVRRMPFEQAIAWPAMLAVLQMAARSFDARKQRLDHPSERAAAAAAVNWYALPAQRTRDHTPARLRAVQAPARPDAKQRQANDIDHDLFSETP